MKRSSGRGSRVLGAVALAAVLASGVGAQGLFGQAEAPAEVPELVASHPSFHELVPGWIEMEGPAWPGEDDRDVWESGLGMSDEEVDQVLETFVTLTLEQLRHDLLFFGRDLSSLTLEELVSEICMRWVLETPYETNSTGWRQWVHGAELAARGVTYFWRIQQNDHRRIVRRRFGICGDYQLLLMTLVDMAIARPQAAHLLADRPRLQPLAVVGMPRMPAFDNAENVVLATNHAAFGIIPREVWDAEVRCGERCQQALESGPDGVREASAPGLLPEHVRVYDLWTRPAVRGEVSALEWGLQYTRESWKTGGVPVVSVQIDLGWLASWYFDDQRPQLGPRVGEDPAWVHRP